MQKFSNVTIQNVRVLSAIHQVVQAKMTVFHVIVRHVLVASNWCVMLVSSIALVTTSLWQQC